MMSKKVLASQIYYVDDDGNPVLCDVVYFDGLNVQHKVIQDTRYADAIEADMLNGYQCEFGLMNVENPIEFVKNLSKKYFGSYFYARAAEMLNLDELK